MFSLGSEKTESDRDRTVEAKDVVEVVAEVVAKGLVEDDVLDLLAFARVRGASGIANDVSTDVLRCLEEDSLSVEASEDPLALC